MRAVLIMIAFICFANPTTAAEYSAGSAQALVQAINAANANNEPDIITLTADIALFQPVQGVLGTPIITDDLLIDGQGFTLRRDVNAPDLRLLTAEGEGLRLVLDDLTLENARLNNGEHDGGALRFSGDELVLRGVTVQDNRAWQRGGGVFFIGDALTIIDSTFNDNGAEIGGGLYSDGTATLINTTFEDNLAALEGGGIFHLGGTLSMVNNRLIRNISVERGGGLAVLDAPLIVNSSLIANNRVEGSGGGIFFTGLSQQSVARLQGVTLIGNVASRSPSFGGGITHSGARLHITDSTIERNSAGAGGGIYNYSAASLDTVILRGNVANQDLRGSAIEQDFVATNLQITDACIIGNPGTAVRVPTNANMPIINTWWGAGNGPGGIGAGSGDAISAGINYQPFLREAPARCT